MPPRFRAALDAVHNIMFALVAGLITWRLFIGAMHKFDDGETTVFLGISGPLGVFLVAARGPDC